MGAVTPVLEARHLSKEFPVSRSIKDLGTARSVKAVNDVSLQLFAGQTLALVGESGSGKSSMARLLALLEKPTSGEILLHGEPVGTSLRKHSRSVQLVLQDPFASLNPIHTVEYILSRPIRLLAGGWKLGREEVRARVIKALEDVQLTPAEQFLPKFPHELSGGQRQRVSIARALAAEPEVLLADEPISMLDVSIRLGVLNLLREVQERRNLALLYITHDIATARYFSDTAVVMYAGQAVESGPVDDVILRPSHPYTRMLVGAAPRPRAGGRQEQSSLVGEPPSLLNPPSGCRFHPRCPAAMAICSSTEPPVFVLDNGQHAKCWLHQSPREEDTPLATAIANGGGAPYLSEGGPTELQP
jgi:peptide/nickel transport system ATP-binding protein